LGGEKKGESKPGAPGMTNVRRKKKQTSGGGGKKNLQIGGKNNRLGSRKQPQSRRGKGRKKRSKKFALKKSGKGGSWGRQVRQ